MLYTEQDIRSIVADEIARLLSINIERKSETKYVTTKEIASILGYGNTKPIYHLINTNVLRVGKEVQDRRSNGSLKADYFFDIDACRKRLNTPPEKRTI